MGQVTIYLNSDVEKKMRSAARGANVSQSQWISRLIEREVADEWPESVRKLVGAWSDFPTAEEIRATEGADVPREEI